MIRFFALLSVVALLFLGAASFAQTTKQPIVIVVSIDGFPARALKDPKLPMPTLKALIAKGAVANAMLPINPTVTWPNHTALITGVNASQHRLLANGRIVLPADGTAPKVLPWVEKSELVHAHTLYEAAADKGMNVGAVDWVAIYGARGIATQFGEKPDLHDHDEIPNELVARGILTQDSLDHFSGGSSAWHDEVWTDAAVDIIDKHQPRLLLLHLLQTDSIQHEYAPLTNASFAAYAYADTCLKRVVDAVQSTGIADRTTFFIVSDHGFTGYTHTISPNVALVEQGFLHKKGANYGGNVWVKAEGGLAFLYTKQTALLPKLKSYFATIPGIDHVYTNAEAVALGLPAEADTDQSPQLYLSAAPGYAIIDDTSGPLENTIPIARGDHGYVNTMTDMQALFVASGAAIKPGVKLDVISNLKVAPTIAKILGLTLPDAKQQPLDEILR